jgi:hypothetical protein
MRAKMKIYSACGVALVALIGSGCGGLHASGSVSPIDFFLPGAGRLLRVEKDSTTNTNAVLVSFTDRAPQTTD